MRDLQTVDFVTVLGDSHVRSFAFDTRFFPLFIENGKNVNFTTEAKAQNTQRILWDNLARVRNDLPILLVFAEPDIRLLNITNPSDQQLVEVIARYKALLTALQQHHHGMIAVYNIVPKEDESYNRVAQEYNRQLSTFCRTNGFVFIDIWQDLFDGRALNPKFCADHVHLNQLVVPYVVDAFAQNNIALTSNEQTAYAWTYLYRLPLAKSETRIWGDKGTDAQSSKNFAATEMTLNAVQRMRKILHKAQDKSVLIVGSSEGFIGVELSKYFDSDIVLYDSNPVKAKMAQRVLQFVNSPQLAEAQQIPTSPFALIIVAKPEGDLESLWEQATLALIIIASVNDPIPSVLPKPDHVLTLTEAFCLHVYEKGMRLNLQMGFIDKLNNQLDKYLKRIKRYMNNQFKI